MKIHLSANARIRDIKAAFNHEFPYLGLEFYSCSHLAGSGNPQKEKLSDTKKLIEVTGVVKEGIIEFNSMNKVEEVEQLFQHKYGLPVQIFRRSRDVWIQTTRTDRFTLARQNRMGKEACNAMYDEEVLL